MIRGIDGQIMINKSVDYAKQMADQMNNVQQGQDFISEMEKVRIQREDGSVTETDRTENGRIRREKDDKEKRDENLHEREEEALEYADIEQQESVEGEATGLGGSIDINV